MKLILMKLNLTKLILQNTATKLYEQNYMIFLITYNVYCKEKAVAEPVDDTEELGDEEGSQEDSCGNKGDTQENDLTHAIEINAIFEF